ncbi:retrovirus-related pol polyprotein from transposon TNT 1-94 [Tanacetum coccineum]
MTSLAEFMIVVGAENRPPMLNKVMYNSWESRMLLYIKGKKNGRMMLESIENRPLVYPTVEEDGQIQKKNYHEGPTNEVRMRRERYPGPLALVANYQVQSNSAHNDQSAKIMGYSDYQMGNVMISWVYYVEGLGHNLFSVGQFYDSDLKVAFRKNSCYIRDLEGVDLLKGSRGSNLYTLSPNDMMSSSPICLLSKALKTNLCSGKSKKHTHKSKAEDSIQEKLYLLHMDLYRPMRIQSINGRKYILVIVDDYSRTNNGIEFINQTLRAYYEEAGISHQTSVARSPQQNGVVERRNQTLVEAA